MLDAETADTLEKEFESKLLGRNFARQHEWLCQRQADGRPLGALWFVRVGGKTNPTELCQTVFLTLYAASQATTAGSAPVARAT